MHLYVAREHAHLIEKLKEVFEKEENVKIAVDRRVKERRRSPQNAYIDQRRRGRRQNRKSVIWAVV